MNILKHLKRLPDNSTIEFYSNSGETLVKITCPKRNEIGKWHIERVINDQTFNDEIETALDIQITAMLNKLDGTNLAPLYLR